MGVEIVFEVQSALKELLSGQNLGYVIAQGENFSQVDYQIPLMSLPGLLGTEPHTIPAQPAYLKPPSAKQLVWQSRLGEKSKYRVGIVWAGGFRPKQPETWGVNKRRNIELSKFARFKNERIEFYSLQKGHPADSELAMLKKQQWNGPEIIDYTNELKDFSDTAALIANLDLIISVDTSAAHLAGALGKPVWILNRFDTCWRWFAEGVESPWYPSVKLYRQEQFGDWDSVLEQVCVDLKRLVIEF